MDIRLLENESCRQFSFSLVCTFSWGLLAHAYAYFHDFFSHDSLNALVAFATEEHWKIELGRFFVPVYRALMRGPIATPWTIGVLSLLWLSLSVYLITRIFKVHSQIYVFLLAGIMTTNATVAAITATYIYELDLDMLSVLFAVLSVYLWKTKKNGFLWGSLCVLATLSIYQCNISITICLVMIDCIIACLRGEKANAVFKRGLRSICMLLIGVLLYYVVLHSVLIITNTKLAQGYNSISNIFKLKAENITGLLFGTYKNAIGQLLSPNYNPTYPTEILIALLGIITVVFAVCLVIQKRISVCNIFLAGILAAILPIGSNCAYILNNGVVHDLMHYATWMYLAFPLFLLAEYYPIDNPSKAIKSFKYGTVLLLALLLFSNSVSANSLYLKKDLEQDATLSMMTRVVYDICNTDGYEEGNTEVCFIGTPTGNRVLPGFEELSYYTGAGASNSIFDDSSFYYYNPYKSYFQYYLNIPIRFCSDEMHNEIKSSYDVKEMPSYPSDGSITWINGVLVIKMS